MEESVDAAVEAWARRHHGAFSRRQAMELGASAALVERRLRNGRWVKNGYGVYVLPGWPRTYKQRVIIATLQAGDGAFASRRCAAMLRDLDGVSGAAVEITTPRRLRAAPKQAIVHTSTDVTLFDWNVVDGIPTATTTRILVDLAGDPSVSLDVLERIFESGQRRGETSHEAVRELFDRVARQGKPGVRRGRALIERLVDDGQVNHSVMETIFFQSLRDAGLPLPVRQKVVLRPDGRFAKADYGYPRTDGLVELLGFRWHSSSEAVTSDVERANDVLLEDKKTIQFTWEHVTRRKDYVITMMERFLRYIGVEHRGLLAQD